MKSRTRDLIAIIIIGLLAFTLGIYHQEFAQFNARFGLFAKNMYLHGFTFFPTTYGQPYPDYPGLPIIFIVLISTLFGGVSLLTAILPTAIISTATLLLIYKIATLHDRRWGWFAVLFTLFTYQFISEARAISLDQYVVFASVFTFWLIYSADFLQNKKRLMYLPLGFIFGFFCRGPIGLVIPAGIMSLYYLCNNNWPALIKRGLIAALTLIICLVILLCFARWQGGSAFVSSVLKNQIFGRVTGATQRDYLFYWTRSMGNYMVTMPIAFAMMIVLAKKLIKPHSPQLKLLQQLTVWILLIMIAMSIPSQKKIRYILPIVPAMALMSAYLFSNVQLSTGLKVIKKITLFFSEYLPILAVIAGIYLFHFNQHHGQLPLKNNVISLIILLVVIFIAAQYAKRHFRTGSDAAIIVGGVMSLFAAQILIVEPVSYCVNQTRPFTKKIDDISKNQNREIVFYQIEPDGLAIKYLVNSNMDFKPVFIYTHQQLLNYPKKAIFVSGNQAFYQTSKDILNKIDILVKGQIGHDDAVAFIKRPAHAD